MTESAPKKAELVGYYPFPLDWFLITHIFINCAIIFLLKISYIWYNYMYTTFSVIITLQWLNIKNTTFRPDLLYRSRLHPNADTALLLHHPLYYLRKVCRNIEHVNMLPVHLWMYEMVNRTHNNGFSCFFLAIFV